MRDEEKIIRVKTFKDFKRELGRDGDEESREGKMSLDGEATDTPITVKVAARFLGGGSQVQVLPRPPFNFFVFSTRLPFLSLRKTES